MALVACLSSLSVAPPRFLIFRSLVLVSPVIPLSPVSLARAPAIHRPERCSGNAECRAVYVDTCVCIRLCARDCDATEMERVKVAESAGQHESSGNVSRELGRGCNRRERVGDGESIRGSVRGNARTPTNVCAYVCVRVCVRVCMCIRAVAYKVAAYVRRTCGAHHITHRSCIASAAAAAAALL